MDKRYEQFAKSLISYSVRLQKGEKILIEVTDTGIDLAKALIKETYADRKSTRLNSSH